MGGPAEGERLDNRVGRVGRAGEVGHCPGCARARSGCLAVLHRLPLPKCRRAPGALVRHMPAEAECAALVARPGTDLTSHAPPVA